jgi:hypothetical protein
VRIFHVVCETKNMIQSKRVLIDDEEA